MEIESIQLTRRGVTHTSKSDLLSLFDKIKYFLHRSIFHVPKLYFYYVWKNWNLLEADGWLIITS